MNSTSPTPAPGDTSASSDTPAFRYDGALAQQIEAYWQDWWEEHGTFNAPNPAGQALLSRFFADSIKPIGLLLGALLPTLIVIVAFRLL